MFFFFEKLKICLFRSVCFSKLITFVNDKEQNVQLGIFYVFILCLSSFTQTVLMQHVFMNQFICGIRLKLSLMNVVYNKSFRLCSNARKTVSTGQMTNLATTDAGAFQFTPFHLTSLVSVPVQILISTYLLWKYLGWATLAGISTMIVFIPLNTFFANINKKFTREKLKCQDKRIKSMNEIFSGIRVSHFNFDYHR